MASFSIRAQLHNAIPAAYPVLHDAMARHGVIPTIRAQNGVVWDLPWGEYRLEGVAASAADVRDYCASIVSSVHSDASILVTEEVQSAWSRLR